MGYYSKAKRRSATKVICVFDDFGTLVELIISGSEFTCFNQSSYQQFFRGKQTSKISIFQAVILKPRRRSKTKEIYIFVLILYYKVAKNGSFIGKRISKINILSLLPTKHILKLKK